jgi:hypothetical protein
MNGSVITWWMQKRLLRKWRKKGHQKKTVRLAISRVPELFAKFNDQAIRYVVLRWFDEVPLTPQDEQNYTEDIDLLIGGEPFNEIARIACQQSGQIKCDLYSVTGRKGTSYCGMPYYPPIIAEAILNSRQLYHGVFYVPSPVNHFLSLAYHVVYHKGLDSGIPSGCYLKSNPDSKRPYHQLLKELGRNIGASIPQSFTLMDLHEYLKHSDWDMPYDLLERWPSKSDWHRHLLQHERSLLQPWVDRMPHLLVFFIREDVIQCDKTEAVYEILQEKFTILKTEFLTAQQTKSVMRKVRGGSWVEHRGTTWIPPKIAIVCYDYNPVWINENDMEKTKAYPLVKNQNVFQKHKVRAQLNNIAKAEKEIIGLHGSDNAYEAQHMLMAIYGQDMERINNELLKQVTADTAEKARVENTIPLNQKPGNPS